MTFLSKKEAEARALRCLALLLDREAPEYLLEGLDGNEAAVRNAGDAWARLVAKSVHRAEVAERRAGLPPGTPETPPQRAVSSLAANERESAVLDLTVVHAGQSEPLMSTRDAEALVDEVMELGSVTVREVSALLRARHPTLTGARRVLALGALVGLDSVRPTPVVTTRTAPWVEAMVEILRAASPTTTERMRAELVQDPDSILGLFDPTVRGHDEISRALLEDAGRERCLALAEALGFNESPAAEGGKAAPEYLFEGLDVRGLPVVEDAAPSTPATSPTPSLLNRGLSVLCVTLRALHGSVDAFIIEDANSLLALRGALAAAALGCHLRARHARRDFAESAAYELDECSAESRMANAAATAAEWLGAAADVEVAPEIVDRMARVALDLLATDHARLIAESVQLAEGRAGLLPGAPETPASSPAAPPSLATDPDARGTINLERWIALGINEGRYIEDPANRENHLLLKYEQLRADNIILGRLAHLADLEREAARAPDGSAVAQLEIEREAERRAQAKALAQRVWDASAVWMQKLAAGIAERAATAPTQEDARIIAKEIGAIPLPPLGADLTAWAATIPVGRPATAEERVHLAESEARLARGERRISNEELMAKVRAHHAANKNLASLAADEGESAVRGLTVLKDAGPSTLGSSPDVLLSLALKVATDPKKRAFPRSLLAALVRELAWERRCWRDLATQVEHALRQCKARAGQQAGMPAFTGAPLSMLLSLERDAATALASARRDLPLEHLVEAALRVPSTPPALKSAEAECEPHGLRLGMTYDEVAALDFGDCLGQGQACACKVCKALDSLLCTCGLAHPVHLVPEKLCPMGFRLASWEGGPPPPAPAAEIGAMILDLIRERQPVHDHELRGVIESMFGERFNRTIYDEVFEALADDKVNGLSQNTSGDWEIAAPEPQDRLQPAGPPLRGPLHPDIAAVADHRREVMNLIKEVGWPQADARKKFQAVIAERMGARFGAYSFTLALGGLALTDDGWKSLTRVAEAGEKGLFLKPAKSRALIGKRLIEDDQMSCSRLTPLGRERLALGRGPRR